MKVHTGASPITAVLPRRAPTVADQEAGPLDRLTARIEGQEQLLKDPSQFDLRGARRKAWAILSGAILASAAGGVLAATTAPAGAALGISAAVSASLACAGAVGANHVMDGVRDPSMFVGTGAMTFFPGPGAVRFATDGALLARPWLAGTVILGAAVGLGWVFAASLESNHHGLEGRLTEARQMLDKYQDFRTQHEGLVSGELA